MNSAVIAWGNNWSVRYKCLVNMIGEDARKSKCQHSSVWSKPEACQGVMKMVCEVFDRFSLEANKRKLAARLLDFQVGVWEQASTEEIERSDTGEESQRSDTEEVSQRSDTEEVTQRSDTEEESQKK
ncbi:Hypothetical predicted protein [Octopus vulgaris]|uniref:Uncharacterized protein n=1 Tax=Octopus vulgaris TaxID=6645 RepID=A0AA36BBW6_OCTVU|nr:Hypothetical predicted protein [Octopus vulgaris]